MIEALNITADQFASMKTRLETEANSIVENNPWLIRVLTRQIWDSYEYPNPKGFVISPYVGNFTNDFLQYVVNTRLPLPDMCEPLQDLENVTDNYTVIASIVNSTLGVYKPVIEDSRRFTTPGIEGFRLGMCGGAEGAFASTICEEGMGLTQIFPTASPLVVYVDDENTPILFKKAYGSPTALTLETIQIGETVIPPGVICSPTTDSKNEYVDVYSGDGCVVENRFVNNTPSSTLLAEISSGAGVPARIIHTSDIRGISAGRYTLWYSDDPVQKRTFYNLVDGSSYATAHEEVELFELGDFQRFAADLVTRGGLS